MLGATSTSAPKQLIGKEEEEEEGIRFTDSTGGKLDLSYWKAFIFTTICQRQR